MRCSLCVQAMQPTIDDDDLVIVEWRCLSGHRELPTLPQQGTAAGQQQAPQRRPDMVIYLPQTAEMLARILAPVIYHIPCTRFESGGGELRVFWGWQA